MPRILFCSIRTETETSGRRINMETERKSNPDQGPQPKNIMQQRVLLKSLKSARTRYGTGDLSVKMRAAYAAGTEGMEAGQQTRLVVVVVADAADEGIPGPATGYACRTVVFADADTDADTVDHRPGARHRRPNQRQPPGNQKSKLSPATTTWKLHLGVVTLGRFHVSRFTSRVHGITNNRTYAQSNVNNKTLLKNLFTPKTVGPPAAENPGDPQRPRGHPYQLEQPVLVQRARIYIRESSTPTSSPLGASVTPFSALLQGSICLVGTYTRTYNIHSTCQGVHVGEEHRWSARRTSLYKLKSDRDRERENTLRI